MLNYSHRRTSTTLGSSVTMQKTGFITSATSGGGSAVPESRRTFTSQKWSRRTDRWLGL